MNSRKRILLTDPQFFEMEQVWHSPAARFDQHLLWSLLEAATDEVGERIDMISFAGHDSAMTALQVPTAMLFIPCKDGVSHSPAEY
jgi:N-carbamoyl-L-amino-acid hydrolase